jgi:hypothetical protein
MPIVVNAVDLDEYCAYITTKLAIT